MTALSVHVFGENLVITWADRSSLASGLAFVDKETLEVRSTHVVDPDRGIPKLGISLCGDDLPSDGDSFWSVDYEGNIWRLQIEDSGEIASEIVLTGEAAREDSQGTPPSGSLYLLDDKLLATATTGFWVIDVS